jgi:hypothetical protein
VILNRRHERERRLANKRKGSHGELCKRVLEQDSTIHTEKLSYRFFARISVAASKYARRE